MKRLIMQFIIIAFERKIRHVTSPFDVTAKMAQMIDFCVVCRTAPSAVGSDVNYSCERCWRKWDVGL